eukprot:scaffold317_cov260-Pinguiococcus_pyrenoidosus.AAC.35
MVSTALLLVALFQGAGAFMPQGAPCSAPGPEQLAIFSPRYAANPAPVGSRLLAPRGLARPLRQGPLFGKPKLSDMLEELDEDAEGEAHRLASSFSLCFAKLLLQAFPPSVSRRWRAEEVPRSEGRSGAGGGLLRGSAVQERAGRPGALHLHRHRPHPVLRCGRPTSLGPIHHHEQAHPGDQRLPRPGRDGDHLPGHQVHEVRLAELRSGWGRSHRASRRRARRDEVLAGVRASLQGDLLPD